MSQASIEKVVHLHAETDGMIAHAKLRAEQASQRARERWKHAIEEIRAIVHSPTHYRAPFSIANREHMTNVDCFDGERARGGQERNEADEVEVEDKDSDDDLLVVTPVIDGRLKDKGRP